MLYCDPYEKNRLGAGNVGPKKKARKTIMKQGIHPDYKNTTITCACGAVYETKSVKENLKVDICSKCHPFFTGKQKFVDAGGRVDKFKKKFNLG